MSALAQLGCQRPEAFQPFANLSLDDRRIELVSEFSLEVDPFSIAVLRVACNTYGLESMERVLGKNRSRHVAETRGAWVWGLRYSGRPWHRIGRNVGRDHSTCISLYRSTELRNRSCAYTWKLNVGILDACGILVKVVVGGENRPRLPRKSPTDSHQERNPLGKPEAIPPEDQFQKKPDDATPEGRDASRG